MHVPSTQPGGNFKETAAPCALPRVRGLTTPAFRAAVGCVPARVSINRHVSSAMRVGS
jgi:hypothetical protein